MVSAALTMQLVIAEAAIRLGTAVSGRATRPWHHRPAGWVTFARLVARGARIETKDRK